MDEANSVNKSSGFWYTHPRPNFGLMLIKAHNLNYLVFKKAWKSYNNIKSSYTKSLVSTDQSALSRAMKAYNYLQGFNFRYCKYI